MPTERFDCFSLHDVLCLKVKLDSLFPPARLGSAGKQIIWEMGQYCFANFLRRQPWRLCRQHFEKGMPHGFVLIGINASDTARARYILDFDFMRRVGGHFCFTFAK
jgi:hypothetical protein